MRIEVRNLAKIFGQVVAVDGLTFNVEEGTVTGLLGPNGAGKTTVLKMIAGLTVPTSGSALIGGVPYRQLTQPLAKVGAVLNAGWQHPGRSARAHLRWVAASHHIPSKRVDDVLGQVGLTEVCGRKAGQLSLGMKQRLGLATALLGDPQLLILDEPANGLDPLGIAWLRDLVRHLAAQGRTVLVSSHQLPEMAMIADRLVVIDHGRLVADAPVADFAANSAYVQVSSPRIDELMALLRSDPMTGVCESADGAAIVTGLTPAAIGQIAAEAGIPLTGLHRQAHSIEDAFIAMTSPDRSQTRPTTAGTVNP